MLSRWFFACKRCWQLSVVAAVDDSEFVIFSEPNIELDHLGAALDRALEGADCIFRIILPRGTTMSTQHNAMVILSLSSL